MELVHPVPVEEARPFLANLITALLGAPFGDALERRVARRTPEWEPERMWGVRDGGRWVATLGTFGRQMTVPSSPGCTADLMTDALTHVSVAATHRRRGLLRRMLTQSLTAAVERGDAVSILLAAEWPIYGRFGYAPATRAAEYRLHTRRSSSPLPADPAGAVRQVEPEELGPLAPDIFARSRTRWAGQVDRPGAWWIRRLGLDGYEPESGNCIWVLHESADGPDGLLGWNVEERVDFTGGLGRVQVAELVAGSDVAYRNLWAYLTALDLVSEVVLTERPVDEPVRWLLANGRDLTLTYAGDHTWLRLLDVPAALSARGYATADEVVIDVIDTDAGGWAAGRYLLDASSCARTSRSADLTLTQRALASAYLGDHSLRALSVAGGVEEHEPGALARLDAMFATPQRPWNPTGF